MTEQQRALALDGARIVLSHLREYEGHGRLMRHEAKRLCPDQLPLAKGGLTAVAIERPDGRTFYGYAVCSPRDNYCKAIGRQIALGRALKAASASG